MTRRELSYLRRKKGMQRSYTEPWGWSHGNIYCITWTEPFIVIIWPYLQHHIYRNIEHQQNFCCFGALMKRMTWKRKHIKAFSLQKQEKKALAYDTSVHIRSKNQDRRYLEEACRDVQSVYVTCWPPMWGRNIHRIYSGNFFLILFLPSELHIRNPEGLDLETSLFHNFH